MFSVAGGNIVMAYADMAFIVMASISIAYVVIGSIAQLSE